MSQTLYIASARRGNRVYEATGVTLFSATHALQLGMVAKAGGISDDIRRAVAGARIQELRIGDCREWEVTESPHHSQGESKMTEQDYRDLCLADGWTESDARAAYATNDGYGPIWWWVYSAYVAA